MNIKSVAVDIGGTTIQVGISQDAESFSSIKNYKLEDYKNPAIWFETVISEQPALKSARWVLGVPGSVQNNRKLLETPNLPDEWSGNSIPDMLSEKKLECIIENDANLAALGEAKFGAGVGCEDLLGLTLGTGLGAGIVIGGNIYRGASGAAGELGHLRLIPDGRECGCGKRGCLETYASASGIKKTYFELSGQNKTAKEIMKLHNNDELATEAVRKTGLWLGSGIAQAVNILEPEIIFFAGGLARSLDLLLPYIKEGRDPLLFAARTKQTPMLPAKLDNPALYGALALAVSI